MICQESQYMLGFLQIMATQTVCNGPATLEQLSALSNAVRALASQGLRTPVNGFDLEWKHDGTFSLAVTAAFRVGDATAKLAFLQRVLRGRLTASAGLLKTAFGEDLAPVTGIIVAHLVERTEERWPDKIIIHAGSSEHPLATVFIWNPEEAKRWAAAIKETLSQCLSLAALPRAA